MSRYQSSLPLFLPSQSTYTPQDVEEALSTMTAALPIITSPYVPSASTSFLPRFPTRSALSLGPLGAQLTPAQEYQGLYPPPFGPASTSAIAYSTAAASMVDLPLARVCTGDPTPEDYLAAWHLSRLEQFATSPTFDDLSMIAFETVPNMSETRAIRRAMALFEVGRRAAGKDDKPFYISYVFPMNDAGQPAIPDIVYRSLPLQQMAEVIIAATFGPSDDSTTPGGIGINCTNPLLLDPIISGLAAALESYVPAPAAPWLILCEFPPMQSLESRTDLSLCQTRMEDQYTTLSLALGVTQTAWMRQTGRRLSSGASSEHWS
jgi:homocysteine S-methyltransferase